MEGLAKLKNVARDL